MVEVDIVYQGELRCKAEHLDSGVEIITDAPLDNHGKGQSFSPTDLLAVSLGSCILTVMGIVAARDSINLIGTKVKVTKEMVNKPLRRIGKIAVTINVPHKITAEEQQKLEAVAATCPVKNSLHPEIEILVTYNWA